MRRRRSSPLALSNLHDPPRVLIWIISAHQILDHFQGEVEGLIVVSKHRGLGIDRLPALMYSIDEAMMPK